MHSMQLQLYVCVFVLLTDYLSSHSIVVIGAQLIQIQSLICKEETNQTH